MILMKPMHESLAGGCACDTATLRLQRPLVRTLHWIIGLGAPVALIWHIIRGRGTHSTCDDLVGPRQASGGETGDRPARSLECAGAASPSRNRESGGEAEPVFSRNPFVILPCRCYIARQAKTAPSCTTNSAPRRPSIFHGDLLIPAS